MKKTVKPRVSDHHAPSSRQTRVGVKGGGVKEPLPKALSAPRKAQKPLPQALSAPPKVKKPLPQAPSAPIRIREHRKSSQALRAEFVERSKQERENPDLKKPPAPIIDDPSDPLTLRERKAVGALLEGKSAHQACLEAGYSPAVAWSASGRTLNKPRIQSALLRAMEAAGITDDLLAKRLKSGLKARKTVFHEGMVVAEVKDLGTRHKYLTTALELRGDLKAAREEQDGSWEEVLLQVRARRALPT